MSTNMVRNNPAVMAAIKKIKKILEAHFNYGSRTSSIRVSESKCADADATDGRDNPQIQQQLQMIKQIKLKQEKLS